MNTYRYMSIYLWSLSLPWASAHGWVRLYLLLLPLVAEAQCLHAFRGAVLLISWSVPLVSMWGVLCLDLLPPVWHGPPRPSPPPPPVCPVAPPPTTRESLYAHFSGPKVSSRHDHGYEIRLLSTAVCQIYQITHRMFIQRCMSDVSARRVGDGLTCRMKDALRHGVPEGVVDV